MSQSVVPLQNGELLACFREAVEHVSVPAKTVIVRSLLDRRQFFPLAALAGGGERTG